MAVVGGTWALWSPGAPKVGTSSTAPGLTHVSLHGDKGSSGACLFTTAVKTSL